MKINKDKLDKIMELLMDYMVYDIEGNSFAGFDITPSIDKLATGDVIKKLNRILEE